LPDIVDQQTRSRMMSGIKAKNTKPEITIRKALYALGFRYRLHAANVPGKPDLVFPFYKATVFVNGCFWHGHDCPLFRMPDTRRAFWDAKISRNRQRDAEVRAMLASAGWRQLTIWECAFRGPKKIGLPATIERAAAWLCSTDPTGEIRAPSALEVP
jgi:DNA mismatch endonuclease (patch repair protein)